MPYLLTAGLGLCLGGGASAASGLVTGAQVKDRSLHGRDFSPRARRALRRARGPRGIPGPKGPAGEWGPPGPVPAASPSPNFIATLLAAGPVAANGTEYLKIGGHGSTGAEPDAQLVLPVFGSLLQMRARVAEPSSAGSRVVRLRLNETDAAEHACSIPPGALTCTTSGSQGPVTGGDRVSVQVVSSSSVATDVSVVFEVQAY